MKYWIKIKIGSTFLPPVLLSDGSTKCNALSMPSLECVLSIPQNSKEIPVVLIYCKGDNYTEFMHDRVSIQKEGGFLTTVSSILGGSKKTHVTVDVLFNDNEEGLCIGFLVSRFKPTKYVLNKSFLNSNGNIDDQENLEIKSTPILIRNSPKDIFIKNYSLFGKLLQCSITNSDNSIISDWEKQIHLIPQNEPLYEAFQKHKNSIPTWIKLLCSWGLKRDLCKRYPGCLIVDEHYKTEDHVPIDSDKDYEVLLPCWTIWIEENGQSIEKTVISGLVRQINESNK